MTSNADGQNPQSGAESSDGGVCQLVKPCESRVGDLASCLGITDPELRRQVEFVDTTESVFDRLFSTVADRTFDLQNT